MLTQLFGRLLVMLVLMLTTSSAFSIGFKPLTEFGANPGQLTASYFSPTQQPNAIVVLLHGCVQDAQELAANSGFLNLATDNNVALLLPQQAQANNIKSCFNWFSSADTDKGSGETLSIINMIKRYKSLANTQDVFIVGLSAGGAMTTNLMIHYPSLFNAGAVIAGIPYPCADNLIKAIACMRSGPSSSAKALVQQIATTNQTWPPLSIWTGLNDSVVNPKNSSTLAQMWQLLSGANQPALESNHDGYRVSQWHTATHKAQIQLIEINNFDHAIAIKPQLQHGGKAALFVTPAPISTAVELFKLWQLNTSKTTQ